jgi:hypothetical protein
MCSVYLLLMHEQLSKQSIPRPTGDAPNIHPAPWHHLTGLGGFFFWLQLELRCNASASCIRLNETATTVLLLVGSVQLALRAALHTYALTLMSIAQSIPPHPAHPPRQHSIPLCSLELEE